MVDSNVSAHVQSLLLIVFLPFDLSGAKGDEGRKEGVEVLRLDLDAFIMHVGL